jgi:hypothetical protein
LNNKDNIINAMMKCTICDGEFPEGKHNFEECYSLDLERDLKQMDKECITVLDVTKIIAIQSAVRGFLCRKRSMPNIIYKMRNTLVDANVICSTLTEDGRNNSCYDEGVVIQLLLQEYTTRVKLPLPRMWYDVLVRDYRYGWIPVNIKTTKTISSDNTGNLAMCLYAYTNYKMDLCKLYNNGKSSTLLYDALLNKNYNYQKKRDYYFIVINKKNNKDIIINSVRGLDSLTPNVNNLPFQVQWRSNRYFRDVPIRESIKQFIGAIQNPSVGWREKFLNNMRMIDSGI